MDEFAQNMKAITIIKNKTLFAFLNKACLRLKKLSKLLKPNFIISPAILTYPNMSIFKISK